MSADKVFYTISSTIPIEIMKDQYADGKAADAWNTYIGDANERTQQYKDFFIGLLRKHGVKKVLDTACGTGIDSMMLVNEGFQVVSVDASDKMLKHALKARWNKRNDRRYDGWVIKQASWETLPQDLESFHNGEPFDALVCLGNSFSHVLDEHGDQRTQRQCLQNFAKCLKTGGLLFIDHRNYSPILNGSAMPPNSLYYNSKYPVDIKTSVLAVHGKPTVVATVVYVSSSVGGEQSVFQLSSYPHQLDQFTRMLDDAFQNNARHTVYADFKPYDEVHSPGYYIHVIEKLG